MSHSNSSLNCFANCMAKYEHNYILHTPPCRPLSPHLIFGTMAHEVLEKAGRQRDEIRDGVREETDYMCVIPSEILYPELKEEFGISSWQKYFMPVIKKVSEYEKQLLATFPDGEAINIEREVKLQLTVDDLKNLGYTNITQPIVGVVDLLIWSASKCYIIDYKFSSSKKTQDDYDMNSQLPLYMLLVHVNRGLPLKNMQVGYIDIPKKALDTPTILANGTISRAKSQNVSQEVYKMAVIAAHGNDPYYNCDEGGYYYEAWCNMANNKAAYLSYEYLDKDVYDGIINDLMKAAKMIDFFIGNKLDFLHKYDSYTCKGCEYLTACKPWLEVNWE